MSNSLIPWAISEDPEVEPDVAAGAATLTAATSTGATSSPGASAAAAKGAKPDTPQDARVRQLRGGARRRGATLLAVDTVIDPAESPISIRSTLALAAIAIIVVLIFFCFLVTFFTGLSAMNGLVGSVFNSVARRIQTRVLLFLDISVAPILLLNTIIARDGLAFTGHFPEGQRAMSRVLADTMRTLEGDSVEALYVGLPQGYFLSAYAPHDVGYVNATSAPYLIVNATDADMNPAGPSLTRASRAYNVTARAWYVAAVQAPPGELVKGPIYIGTSSGNVTATYSLAVRPPGNPPAGSLAPVKAVLGADIQVASLAEALRDSVGYDACFASVIDTNGIVLASSYEWNPALPPMNRTLDKATRIEVRAVGRYYVKHAVNGTVEYLASRDLRLGGAIRNTLLVRATELKGTGWILVVILSKEGFMSSFDRAMRVSLITGGVVLLILLLVVFAGADLIIRPILETISEIRTAARETPASPVRRKSTHSTFREVVALRASVQQFRKSVADRDEAHFYSQA